MQAYWKEALERELGSALGMLADVIEQCPEKYWTASLWEDAQMPTGLADFWYLCYHTLFWFDLYLSGAVEGFAPPEPFSLDELDPAGLLPPRVYAQAEMLGYIDHCRQKCRAILETLTDEQAQRACRFPWGEVTYAALLLDNMRHVQEHGAQLRLFLGQQAGINSRWLG
jgi:hypothetical protein